MLIWFKLILLKVPCKIPRTFKKTKMVMAKPEEIVEEEVEAEDLEEAEMVGTMVEDLSANYGKIGHIVWQC